MLCNSILVAITLKVSVKVNRHYFCRMITFEFLELSVGASQSTNPSISAGRIPFTVKNAGRLCRHYHIALAMHVECTGGLLLQMPQQTENAKVWIHGVNEEAHWRDTHANSPRDLKFCWLETSRQECHFAATSTNPLVTGLNFMIEYFSWRRILYHSL